MTNPLKDEAFAEECARALDQEITRFYENYDPEDIVPSALIVFFYDPDEGTPVFGRFYTPDSVVHGLRVESRKVIGIVPHKVLANYARISLDRFRKAMRHNLIECIRLNK